MLIERLPERRIRFWSAYLLFYERIESPQPGIVCRQGDYIPGPTATSASPLFAAQPRHVNLATPLVPPPASVSLSSDSISEATVTLAQRRARLQLVHQEVDQEEPEIGILNRQGNLTDGASRCKGNDSKPKLERDHSRGSFAELSDLVHRSERHRGITLLVGGSSAVASLQNNSRAGQYLFNPSLAPSHSVHAVPPNSEGSSGPVGSSIGSACPISADTYGYAIMPSRISREIRSENLSFLRNKDVYSADYFGLIHALAIGILVSSVYPSTILYTDVFCFGI
ncbi:unnamed protein product [Protopolystoma xenopodis]|uniref:Uncharacterized protein n=1 Tax=Protopolystoma xenopodis TaxID=117903 RepID=A0A3S5FCU7_9PLAT|nr:unnamed protein product [Protopolystoma xenopodis]